MGLAQKVADEIVCEETEILEKIVPRMFEVMQSTVKNLCDYIKRGRFGRQSHLVDLEYCLLMIAGRMRDGLMNPNDNEMIEKMAGELADIIEDFMHAVDVETLCLAKESGERPCPHLAIIHS